MLRTSHAISYQTLYNEYLELQNIAYMHRQKGNYKRARELDYELEKLNQKSIKYCNQNLI